MKYFLLWIWQLPQNIIGLICTIKHSKKEKCDTNDGEAVTVYYHNSFWRSAVSLGNYIIADKLYSKNAEMVNHEHGHQIQSRILGPFYLIFIGLPSLVGNLVHRIHKFPYYKQPWEAWADKLGGVKRIEYK